MKKDRTYFAAKKQAGEPIVMLTCYDYPTALAEDEAGVDIVFVGDSLGTNVLGYASETEVTMADMLHHLGAVRRGVENGYLLVDMPYRAYETPEIALANARAFLQAGADGVKLEGGQDQAEVVRTLTEHGIEVCGHIGFTPQTLGSKGRVQGKSFEQARELANSALALERAGAVMLVLEMVTEGVARLITQHLHIPTIGIGAGRFCDGQVLVINDVLGISPFTRKITKRYQEYRETTRDAVRQYREDVITHRFPSEGNAFSTPPDDLALLEDHLSPAGRQVEVCTG